jgi:L-lactate permease
VAFIFHDLPVFLIHCFPRQRVFMAVNHPDNPNLAPPPMGAQGVIFAVVGFGCGIFSVIKLSSVLPVWVALLVTILLWCLLLGSSMASYGPELQDILIGSVVIIIAMLMLTMFVIRGVRSWQHKHQNAQPPAANVTRVNNNPRLSCRAKCEIYQRWIESRNAE